MRLASPFVPTTVVSFGIFVVTAELGEVGIGGRAVLPVIPIEGTEHDSIVSFDPTEFSDVVDCEGFAIEIGGGEGESSAA